MARGKEEQGIFTSCWRAPACFLRFSVDCNLFSCHTVIEGFVYISIYTGGGGGYKEKEKVDRKVEIRAKVSYISPKNCFYFLPISKTFRQKLNSLFFKNFESQGNIQAKNCIKSKYITYSFHIL